MTLLSRLKNLSEQLFTKHLFLTNTTLGVFFFGVADVVQQNIEKKLYEGKKFESKRTGNMVVAGTVVGIGGHYWYTFLDRRFPGAARKAVLKKLLCEMAIGPPLFLAFFVIMGYLNQKPIKKSTDEFMKNLPLVLAADWAIYAPLQAVNFFYVHPKYRFLYVCALCFVYDIFVSYITHKEENEKYAKKST